MRTRTRKLLGHSVRLALFVLAGVAALRYFLDSLGAGGWTPRTTFGFLILTGAVSLVWRATLDLQKARHRPRRD